MLQMTSRMERDSETLDGSLFVVDGGCEREVIVAGDEEEDDDLAVETASDSGGSFLGLRFWEKRYF